MSERSTLFDPLVLPCGVVLKNRIAKSAMSDSLGDGTGHPTAQQISLYNQWAQGGLALAIIGEVQGTPDFAEKPGNLVLNHQSDLGRFRNLAKKGQENGTALFLQLGHAGALAYGPTSIPKGPSALNVPGLKCAALSRPEIESLPGEFAQTARLTQQAGFGGIQIHAAHGFLLSQFLSPLFNTREDEFGGSIENRMRPLIQSIEACRKALGPKFPIAVKLNSSDLLEGGLSERDSLRVVEALDRTSVDLIDISGGTYFPGAKSASDASGGGPYFLRFAEQARKVTGKPLMLTGGVKTRAQAQDALSSGTVDMVGLARAFALEPSLPKVWASNDAFDIEFPRFSSAPEGGITAWYTMRLSEVSEHQDPTVTRSLEQAIKDYEARDGARTKTWLAHFQSR